MSDKKKNTSLEDLMNTFGQKENENETQELNLDMLDVSDNENEGGSEISVGDIDVNDTSDSLTLDKILENMTANSVEGEAEEGAEPVSDVAETTVSEDPAPESEEIKEIKENNTHGTKKEKKNKKRNKTKSEPLEESAPSAEIAEPVPEVVAEPVFEEEKPEEKVNKKKEAKAKKETKEKKDTKDKKEKKDKKDKKDKKEKGKPSKSEKPKAKDKKTEKTEKHKKAEKKSFKKDVSDGSASTKEKKAELKSASPIKLVVTLTVICVAVALLLAAVNHFTAPKIEENNNKAILDSIRNIFDESVQAEEIASPEGSGFTSLYLVMKDEGICGYSAAVSPAGFGGPINLMVGMDSVGTVVGVDVVSMSETPGLGSKTAGSEFLSQFVGASGDISVDAISGASISSNAVAEGVRSVTTNLLDLETIAKERGIPVVAYVRDNKAESTAETTAPVTETVAVVPDVSVTTVPVETEVIVGAPDVSKNDIPPEIIVQNPGNENPGIDADYTEVTTEFETLTTEPESSDLTSSETSVVSE